MKSKKSDIVAVAKAARVSPSTVSRSFNHPDLVKPATRKKIDAAVRRLGYIRNRAAQTIHGIRSGTVGLIVPTIDHAIFAELIESFSQAIEELGFTILVASHGYDLQREYALARKMLEHRVDGMALIGTTHDAATFDLLDRQEIPTTLLWSHGKGTPFPCVGADNYQAGWLIGDHIGRLGHRDIALLFPPVSGNDRADQRRRGVIDALAAQGVTVPAAQELQSPYSVAAAKEDVIRLIASDARPDAVICGNDVLAWGALHGLCRAGLGVPEDVAVAGIGDFKGSREFEPGLTTVRIPARQIGQKAAALIADMIVNPQPDPQSEQVVPELVVRSTCGAAIAENVDADVAFAE